MQYIISRSISAVKKSHRNNQYPRRSKKNGIKEVFVKALNKFIVNKDNIIPDLKAIRAMLMDTTQLEKQLTEAQASHS